MGTQCGPPPEGTAQSVHTQADAPTIILFMVDQLSAKWLEIAWAGACPTPNLDRLRARGTTFTNAITSNPVCMPARATLATGLTTRGHGVLENGYQLDPELPTYVPYHLLFGRRDYDFPELQKTFDIDLDRINPKTRLAVNEMIEEYLDRPLTPEQKEPEATLEVLRSLT